MFVYDAYLILSNCLVILIRSCEHETQEMIVDEAAHAIQLPRYMLENLVYTYIVGSLNCLDLNYCLIFAFTGFFLLLNLISET